MKELGYRLQVERAEHVPYALWVSNLRKLRKDKTEITPTIAPANQGA